MAARRVLHIDPFGGSAGDMMVAALLDLGIPARVMDQAVEAVGLAEVRVVAEREQRHGVGGLRAVFVDRNGRSIDPLERTDHDRDHDHGHQHEHDHSHHVSWGKIRARIESAKIARPVRAIALKIFSGLAAAESRVHGVSEDDVTFHEVGSADAIADIVATAAGLHHLEVAAISCGPIPLGGTAITAAHGVLPAPAPATSVLCVGAAIRGLDVDYECTTPTGAAILTAVTDRYGELPAGRLVAVGVGLGRMDPGARANLLRLFLVEPAEHAAFDEDQLFEVRANLDDETGEVVGHAIGRLLDLGALDAWVVPATMKRGRPAMILHALVNGADRPAVSMALLAETSTLGVRYHPVERHTLGRRLITVQTRYGAVRVKLAFDGERLVKMKPEYDDCERSATAAGVALRDVIQAALVAASEVKVR